MADSNKMFISYSTKDRVWAQKLYNDLKRAGADVFEFERTAEPGEQAWKTVLKNIASSGYFLLLVSANSNQSEPVDREIGFAYHRNANGKDPKRMIPILLEEGCELPLQMEMFTSLDFTENQYAGSLKRLLEEAGLSAPEIVSQPKKPAKKKAEPESSPPVEEDSGAKDLNPSGANFLRTPASRTNQPKATRFSPIWDNKSDFLQKYQGTLATSPDRLGAKRISGPQPALRSKSSSASSSTYSSDLKGPLIAVALIAGVALLLAFFLLPLLQELARTQLSVVTGWAADRLSNAHWVSWVSGILIGLICIWRTWVLLEDDVSIDSFDYGLATLKCLVIPVLLGLVWVILMVDTVSDGAARLAFMLILGVTSLMAFAYTLLDNL